jgi:hypothetical protein
MEKSRESIVGAEALTRSFADKQQQMTARALSPKTPSGRYNVIRIYAPSSALQMSGSFLLFCIV